MKIQNYNSAVTLLIHLIVMNNPGGVARALKNLGYDSRNYVPASELEKALLQLHYADKEEFFQLMRNVSWNYGDMATNKPEIKQQLIELTGSDVSPNAKVEWWQLILQLVQGAPPTSSYTPTAQSGNNTNIMIGLALVIVAVAIGIFVIWKLK